MKAACGRCRFWSQTCAEWLGGEPEMKALCENPDGPKSGRMTRESETCPAFVVSARTGARTP